MVVSYTTSDAEMTVGDVTTSTLSIWAVDPQVDYGVYICNSNNNIGQPDSHEIIVNGTSKISSSMFIFFGFFLGGGGGVKLAS